MRETQEEEKEESGGGERRNESEGKIQNMLVRTQDRQGQEQERKKDG